MTTIEEVFVVTSTGSGHLFPSIELCKHLSSRNYQTTLFIPSIPSSFLHHHPLISTSVPSSAGPSIPGSDPTHQQMASDLEAHISRILTGSGSTRPDPTLPTNKWSPSSTPTPPESQTGLVHQPGSDPNHQQMASDLDPTRLLCAIVDFKMGWTNQVFSKFKIPVISFFTFGACAAAMEWGAWKSDAGTIRPGEEIKISGLPEETSVTYSDVNRGRGGGSGPRRGPPKPGDEPPWVRLIEGSIGLMFNTCDDLEHPFIKYLANELGIPVWGVGPLLPEQYFQPSDSIISDCQIRQAKQYGNYSEDEVIQWLDSKPRGSVLYVAFGSEVGPTTEEYPELAAALEDSTRPFIWVIQTGGRPDLSGRNEDYFPHGMEGRVGNRGLIIKGWAPQLTILSHESTGGFLSHCGWNSTAEAVARGVPVLTWPIRGDQIYNAKLVVGYLKIGCNVLGGGDIMVKKEYISDGIEKLMNGGDFHERASAIKGKFEGGFPASSESCLDDFGDFVRQNAALVV